MNRLHKYILSIFTNLKVWIIASCLFFYSPLDNAYCLDTISFKQFSSPSIELPSKIDLTSLPHRKVFMVPHPMFTLKFFYNNKTIRGFILKREKNFGILIHLCFFRSCDESPYDINQIIAMPQDPPPDRTFFSVKFPHGLQYKFQGIEFRPIN